MEQYVLGFDVYGTLVDPLAMGRHLRPLAGEQADRLAALWREKQIEYAFRRALMRQYADFDVCTHQALQYATRVLGLTLDGPGEAAMLAAYRQLDAFPDVAAGLAALRGRGHRLVAFSNGVEASVQALLAHAGLLDALEQVVSVDDVRSFKPDPAVYAYLASRAGSAPERTWLISSNAWDVIGAKAAGLRAAWVRRRPDALFDPWDIAPDLVVGSIAELGEKLTVKG